MSKAAINHLTRCLAAEWARYNVTVNTVSPTFIHTDGTAPFLADAKIAKRRSITFHSAGSGKPMMWWVP